ncbi:MAG: glycosyltransferase [Pseudomonadota bacterium]
MKILTYSTLFPNAAFPQHGIFVAERLKHLLSGSDIEATVVAPVPWVPMRSKLFPRYSKWTNVPKCDAIGSTDVLHPRYPVIPKIGMSVAPTLLALWTLNTLRRLQSDGSAFDLIDAHYFYPDGVAAALLGRWLDKPVVITGRGTDLNLIPEHWMPRKQIQWAASRAAQMATVSESLRTVLTSLGVPESKTRTLRNGVDLEVFSPSERRKELRQRRGISGVSLLTVGHLIERKGHHLAIQALQQLPSDVELRIAGDGPMEASLRETAAACSVSDRVDFLGRLERPALVDAYNAADILVLASSREGMANVLLESMSCGTPVVATDVWGAPEVVGDRSGELVASRDPADLAKGVERLLQRGVTRAGVRQHAEQFSWQATTDGQLDMFERALRAGAWR